MTSSTGPLPTEARREGQRYLALDAMRGLVMLMLVSHAFGLGDLKDPGLQWLASNFEHLKWDGLIPWELIMPSFMIGIALPFALASRIRRGFGFRENLRHAI